MSKILSTLAKQITMSDRLAPDTVSTLLTQLTISNRLTPSIIYELAQETTCRLRNAQEKLKLCRWKDGESNLDTHYSTLACKCCEDSWDIMKRKYPEHINTTITCEKPDINIIVRYSDDTTSNHKIELKSSKSTVMCGSTIGTLDENQPLIYCLRPSTESEPYLVRCSLYHMSMVKTETDLFQDRTPRPRIDFYKMGEKAVPFQEKEKEDWLSHVTECALHRVEPDVVCRSSWQDSFIAKIKKKVIDMFIRNTSVEEFAQLKREGRGDCK